MKPSAFTTDVGFLLLHCFLLNPAWAQLRVSAEASPLLCFSGMQRLLRVTVQNPGTEPVLAPFHARLYQATSATAAPFGEQKWKSLHVLAGQTILESAAVDLPAVRAETPFVIQWLGTNNELVGLTKLLVYPPDLLRDIKPLLAGEPLGVFDPQNLLKPLLKSDALDFLDLENSGLEHFTGKLAIIGPFAVGSRMPEFLTRRIKALAGKGAGVVWIQPPPEPHDALQPSFYIVPEGKGTVVVVQAHLVEKLAESPASQLNLIRCCRLAVCPQPFQLPELEVRP